MDTDGDGKVYIGEFLTWYTEKKGKMLPDQRMINTPAHYTEKTGKSFLQDLNKGRGDTKTSIAKVAERIPVNKVKPVKLAEMEARFGPKK
jgi:hypothetical protein